MTRLMTKMTAGPVEMTRDSLQDCRPSGVAQNGNGQNKAEDRWMEECSTVTN
jgi:hypothetical protein